MNIHTVISDLTTLLISSEKVTKFLIFATKIPANGLAGTSATPVVPISLPFNLTGTIDCQMHTQLNSACAEC
ncbi:hypothetical protein GHT06_015896 [Daphnia sinensis]|uniref:Uncharacterized protein n=1 Tax=Daphnia sinensis TaxID=1820382 RepID=A0AAD5KRT2_9CRUS|nr:hypothetical protein GHT06_015896 [Daphnia sinensis]